MKPLLAAWLDEAAARDWDWTSWNCILAAADWAVLLTGRDPAAAWRADCRDEASARAIVRRAGGLTALARDALEPQGWTRTARPIPGAVGIVRRVASPDVGARTGRIGFRTGFAAVCLGDRWALASSEGVIVERMRVVAAWEFRHG